MSNYPRSVKYDQGWISANWMGPNPIILIEELCKNLTLKPGMKVLDLGCGKGLTSIFLANEFGVQVFATDLWIDATENLKRIEGAGISNLVFPINAQAHALPYADGFFDAVICIDSYQYFGTDEMYLSSTLSKLVKKGGQFGIVVPGLKEEFDKGYPDTLEDLWEPEMFSFHSKEWWRKLWNKTKTVNITSCYDIENTKELWMPWAEWSKEHLGFNDLELLNADTNNDLSLIVMTATKK